MAQQGVTVTIGDNGEGQTLLEANPADVSLIKQPDSGTASVYAGPQANQTCVKVVNSTPKSTQTVYVEVAESSPSNDGQVEPTTEPSATQTGEAESTEQAGDTGVQESAQTVQEPEGEQTTDPTQGETAAVESTVGQDERESDAPGAGEPTAPSAPAEAEQESADVEPQNAGAVPSESAGTGDQAGAPSEEHGEAPHDELVPVTVQATKALVDATNDGLWSEPLRVRLTRAEDGEYSIEFARGLESDPPEGQVRCPVCQHTFAPGTPAY